MRAGKGNADSAAMKAEMTWQKDAVTDNAAFKSNILAMQDVRLFGYMREGLPFVHTIHLQARYPGIGGTSELKGKEIGFVGDYNKFGGTPMPYVVPKEKPWFWKKVKGSFNVVACGVFYGDSNNKEKPWRPTADESTKKDLPRFLLLPRLLGKYAAESPITPWELKVEASKNGPLHTPTFG